MSVVPRFHLGAFRTFESPPVTGQAHMPAHHCCTHVVTLGASGSGKTGVTLVMVEEALRNGVPVLMIDVKGDLPNLLLRFPRLTPEALVPWTENAAPGDARTPIERAAALAQTHAEGLRAWDITEAAVQAYAAGSDIRVITPGSTSGELSGSGAASGPELAKVVKMLAQRWFLMRNVHAAVGTMLLQPRWAMSVMRGPMTRGEIRRALGGGE